MKPFYDVEQAQKDVEERAKGAQTMARQTIEEAYAEAVRKLEVQARAFAELPNGISDLMKSASHIWIEEITALPNWGVGDIAAVEFNAWVVCKNGSQTQLGSFFPKRIGLPDKKHRMIAFFIPVEE